MGYVGALYTLVIKIVEVIDHRYPYLIEAPKLAGHQVIDQMAADEARATRHQSIKSVWHA
jgi:hypothetical protein